MNKLHLKNVGNLLLAIVALSLLNGCARQISGNVYAADHVGETSRSYPGVIVSARGVLVQDKERLEENTLGIGAGAVGGALVGSAIGKGKGNTVATIAGGVLGATAGAFAEKALKEQNGMEYMVRLDNGEMRSVVQGPDPSYGVGQLVYVIESHKGRSRIIAR
jgi:outer membrane lipoprotein SlyB